jgi:hypothetical protein
MGALAALKWCYLSQPIVEVRLGVQVDKVRNDFE